MALMLVALSLIACQSAPKLTLPSDGTAVKDADQVETIRRKAGGTFTIPLESNHTTGYSWTLDGKEDSTVVRKVGSDYINDPHLPGMVGFGGTERWKFRAEKKGTTVLHFIYRRPWEKDVKPARERSFKVVVEYEANQ